MIKLNMLPRQFCKIIKKKSKHVNTVVNSIQPLSFPTTNTISNTHNNKIPQVDFFENNLSKSSREDQDIVYDEISY